MAADEPPSDTSGGDEAASDTGTDTDGSGGTDHGAVDDDSFGQTAPAAGADGVGDLADASDADSSRWRRRSVLLLLVVLLVLVGGGVGTFVLDGGNGGAGTGTPTATAQAAAEPGDGPAPTQSPTPTPVTSGPTGELAIEFLGSDTLVEAGGVWPGQAGNSTVVVVNNGSMAGRLAVADLNHTDRENGVVSPESEVDTSTATGELSAHLEVSLSIVYADGESVTVFGGEDDYVALEDVAAANRTIGEALGPGERARIRFAWRVSSDAGNEIQSDSTTFDVVFQLRAPEPTASG